MPPFEACVTQAHAKSFMCSYNAVNGVPACANDFLLNQLLRKELDWDGFVVSDCGAIDCIETTHHYTKTPEDTVAVAVKAGTDMDCSRYYSHIGSSIAKGKMTESDVNTAVMRSMINRFELGMFDPDDIVSYKKIPASAVDTPATRALALRLARESLVILRNDGNILPIDPKKYTKFAIIGPNADNANALLGNYHGTPPFTVTPRQAFANRSGIASSYLKGCDIDSKDKSQFDMLCSIPSGGAGLRKDLSVFRSWGCSRLFDK